MKISATNLLLFVTLFCTAGLCVPCSVRAEDSDLNRANDAVGKATLMIQAMQSEQQSQSPQNSPYGNNPFSRGGSSFFSVSRPGPNVTSAIRKAAEAVRDAKGDEAKSDAQKKLAELLSKCYDDDMVQREHELEKIEERLAKLRDLLERRHKKKQEIIELQMKVALNEAEGLGFYDSERAGKAGPLGLPPFGAVPGTVTITPGAEPATAPIAPKPPRAPKAAR